MSNYNFTVEEKAQMFDALIQLLGKPEIFRWKYLPIERQPSIDLETAIRLNEVKVHYRQYPVYVWKILADNDDDLLNCMARTVGLRDGYKN